jgi:hypothetical protein
MVAERKPIEIDPDSPLGEAIERALEADGQVELRVGGHLLLVHRAESDSSDGFGTEPVSNVERVIAAARDGKNSIDAEAMKAFIYEMRDSEAARPRYVSDAE